MSPITAVSYTHLDVYKRQPALLVLAVFYGIYFAKVLAQKHRGIRTRPVSYTHLDVYKRQGIYQKAHLHRLRRQGIGINLKAAPVRQVQGQGADGIGDLVPHCLLYTSRCV